jgi:uncharacterized protein YqgC (DUF456 family)
METLLLILSSLLVILGLVGTLVPVLPGLLLVFLGLVLWAWTKNFQSIPTGTIEILALLTALGFVLDFLAGAWGAKAGGASKKAIWGSVWGGIIGIFFGPVGLILGPMLGAVIGQMFHNINHGYVIDNKEAIKVAFSTLAGLILGTFAKLLIGILMIIAAWNAWTF